jgi:thiopeptide-type bacteriocin biosynthesis protein
VRPASDERWVSLHLFYHGPLDFPIRVVVRPLFRTLADDGVAELRFFVRYWQGGPHLRIRLRPIRQEDVEEVRRRLEYRVDEFLRIHPSEAVLDADEFLAVARRNADLENIHAGWAELYPNNSWRQIPYVPELGRYGGPAAMPAVERLFSVSSDVAADLVDASTTLERRVGHYFAATVVAAGVYSRSLAGSSSFFAAQAGFWLTRAERSETVHDRLEDLYQQERDRLGPLMPKILDIVWSGDEARTGPHLARWCAAIRELNVSLGALRQTGQLTLDQYLGDPIRAILLSCLHMHANRLGLSIFEEARVGVTLSKLFGELHEARLDE